MSRTRILELLAQSKPALMARYGLVDLALFGFAIRETAEADSDIAKEAVHV